MPTPATTLERWLATDAIRAEVLLAIAHDDLEHARSAMASSAAALHRDAYRWSVDGGKVTCWHHEHGEGAVTARRLVALALEARTDAKADRLRAAYRGYVEVAARHVPFPKDRDAEPEQLEAAQAHAARYAVASRALEDARRAWWALEDARPVQGSLFEAAP